MMIVSLVIESLTLTVISSYQFPTSCTEIKPHIVEPKDGEYCLQTKTQHVKIYCHNMTSYNPREFVTLPSGESENYMITGSDSKSQKAVGGPYYFSKIRMDLSQVKVLTNDHTFRRVVTYGNLTPVNRKWGRVDACSSCSSLSYYGTGVFNIQLTPFQFHTNFTYQTLGYQACKSSERYVFY